MIERHFDFFAMKKWLPIERCENFDLILNDLESFIELYFTKNVSTFKHFRLQIRHIEDTVFKWIFL